MADKLDVHNCPTCGHPCLVASSDEGTSHYWPIGWEDERTELIAERDEARAYRDRWESTARRLATESGWENSDYLEPDEP